MAASTFFARAGADVAMIFRSRKREAAASAAKLSGLGIRAIALRADISKERQVAKAFGKALERLGGLDFLVNNAGIWPGGSVEKISLQNWEETFAVNMRGTFLFT